MKEIAERFPKAWRLAVKDLPLVVKLELFQNKAIDDNLQFYLLFGYLVLEFFPKYGIEIERIIMEDMGMCYAFHCKNMEWAEECKIPIFKNPKEAIEKAFEIIEKQLDRK